MYMYIYIYISNQIFVATSNDFLQLLYTKNAINLLNGKICVNVWREFIDRSLIMAPSSLYSVLLQILEGIYFLYTKTGKHCDLVLSF